MGKKNKKNTAKDIATEGQENIENPTPAVGKKKGKKQQDDDWMDSVQDELESLKEGPKVDADKKDESKAEEQTQAAAPKKKGKKKKVVDDDWENEVQNEIENIQNNIEPEAGDDEKKPAKKKNKKPKGGEEKNSEPSDIKTKEEVVPAAADGQGEKNDEETTATSKKKQKKKKKGEKVEPEKPRKGGLGKGALKAMKEALQKKKEEEERLQKEEEERFRKEEEEEKKRLEALEAERLKREKKKQDKKDRIQRLKQEGKYLTPAQREMQRRREAYREELIKQGLVPDKEAEAVRKPRYERKKKQQKPQPKPEPTEVAPAVEEAEPVEVEEPMVIIEEQTSDKDIEDDWENIDNKMANMDVKSLSSEEDTSSGEESSEEDQEESSEDGKDTSPPLSSREQALHRIQKQKDENESKRSIAELRSPVVCVLGHVDTGKTKILDKIRHSHVQDGEAGGITQQIGATNIPTYAIKEQTRMVKSFQGDKIRIPGLLVIDTPGHESFGNLRSRGSSNCDIAILVVDIMHGLEPQTLESIRLLKKNKTPFVVALNKVDRLYEWKSNPDSDVVSCLKKQKSYVLDEFREKVNGIVVQFATESLNVKLFHENDDPDTWISMVPTSAHSGDGMGDLMALLVDICQTRLASKICYSENLQCTVLEVKAIQGLGTTIDVILTNGRLKYGDTIVLPGTEGPIVTHVKGLLMPQPLRELRVKNPYNKYDEIKAAQGVKILAKDLDKALAGTGLLVAKNEDEVEVLKEEVQAQVSEALSGIKLKERGVFVQASTLGSLEALLEFLKTSKIPFAGIGIGPVCKKDVSKASVMLEHDSQWAVILAFDVKVEREAQEIADGLGVKIFTADIIYHLFDAFTKHREEQLKRKRDEFRQVAVFPCKVRIVPNCVFKSRDPIIIGVRIEGGQLRLGTPLCVPDRDSLKLGVVTSMQVNHKDVEVARSPMEVCIKVEGAPGEAPKMVGRHFDETDSIVSRLTRDSIDALKTWFRDEMHKTDWQLTIELKKLFEII